MFSCQKELSAHCSAKDEEMPGPHLKLRHSLEKGSQTWHRLAREKYAAACVPTPPLLTATKAPLCVTNVELITCRLLASREHKP